MARSERGYPLAEPGRQAHTLAEHHARQATCGDAVGELRHLAACAGQPSDDEAAADARAQRRDQLLDFVVARIAVHHGEIARVELMGSDILRRFEGRQDAEIMRIEFAQHHRHRRLLEIFHPGGAHSDPDGTDPMRHSGRAFEERQNGIGIGSEVIGKIEKPQRRRGGNRPQLCHAGLGGMRPVGVGGVGVLEWRGHRLELGSGVSDIMRNP